MAVGAATMLRSGTIVCGNSLAGRGGNLLAIRFSTKWSRGAHAPQHISYCEVSKMSSAPSPQSPQFRSAPSFASVGRRLLYYGAGSCLILFSFLAAWSRVRALILADDYMPHLYCYLGS